MKNLNRRSFLSISAASAGAALLGATGCTALPSPTPNRDNTTENSSEVNSVDIQNANPATEEALLTANIAQAAIHFLDGLNDLQRTQATYEFGGEERFRWHWTNPTSFPRNGLPLRDMSEEQKLRAHELLQASLSEGGLEKALNIMSLQRELGSDPELYYVTIFGTPNAAEPWGWRWEGHHLSHHFTIVDDTLATMPFFLGAWPTNTEAGVRAMPRAEDAGLELVNSFGGAALDNVLMNTSTLRQHVTQNAARVNPLDPIGRLYGDMNDRQQSLVVEIIQTYLNTQSEHVATSRLANINEMGLEQIRFAWAGSMEYSNPQYYRLQGPTFLLEFDNSRNGGTHIHSVWRDFERDFGYHLL